MRDIRFRIYDKSKKKMFYKTLIGIWGNWEDVKDDENYTSCAVYDERWKHVEPYMDDIELMQFTGLYDKNKVPIYEGDIVETKYGEKYTVEFKTERAGFYPFACGDGCGCCEEETWSADCSEILGNIYENSDLLGE